VPGAPGGNNSKNAGEKKQEPRDKKPHTTPLPQTGTRNKMRLPKNKIGKKKTTLSPNTDPATDHTPENQKTKGEKSPKLGTKTREPLKKRIPKKAQSQGKQKKTTPKKLPLPGRKKKLLQKKEDTKASKTTPTIL